MVSQCISYVLTAHLSPICALARWCLSLRIGWSGLQKTQQGHERDFSQPKIKMVVLSCAIIVLKT